MNEAAFRELTNPGREDLAEIAVVVDRSGSMGAIWSDACGGYHHFVTDQKQFEGTGRLTVAAFDDQYELVHDGADLAHVSPDMPAGVHPRGSTALNDAIGRTLTALMARLQAAPESERPSRVIVAIITDGLENASREWTGPKVKELLAAAQRADWQFFFFGADAEAIGSATRELGIRAGNAVAYEASAAGTAKAYAEMSLRVKKARSG